MAARERVTQLIEWVQTGRAMEAYREFYAPDAVMQENDEPPRTNVEQSIERQATLTKNITLNEFRADSVLVDGDRAAIVWVLDATTPDGKNFHQEEVAVSTWKDGKIVHERFFYKPGVPK